MIVCTTFIWDKHYTQMIIQALINRPKHPGIHSWGGRILPLAKSGENTLLDV